MRPENFLYDPIIALLIVIFILVALIDRNNMVGIDSLILLYILFLFYFILFWATQRSLWDLSSLTRD